MSKRMRFWFGLISILVLLSIAAGPTCPPPPDAELIVNCEEGTVSGEAWGRAMFQDIWIVYSDGSTYFWYFDEPVSEIPDPLPQYEYGKCIEYADAYAVHPSFEGGRKLIVAEDFDCGCKEPRTGRKSLSCPKCESPKWEDIPDGEVASLQYSVGECVVNLEKWCLEVDTWVRFVGHNQSFKIFYLGVTYTPEARVGADGDTWYSLDIDLVGYNHDYVWLNADAPDITSLIGFDDAWRLPRELLDYGRNEYVVCSMAPSYADTDEAGMAYMHAGHVVSDWAKFLLQEGYFADEQYRGDVALAWANELYEVGSLPLP
jgi:rhodanese-related sulfurtransferase